MEYIAHTQLIAPENTEIQLAVTSALELYIDNVRTLEYSSAGALCIAALAHAKNIPITPSQLKVGVESIFNNFCHVDKELEEIIPRDSRHKDSPKGELQVGACINEVLQRSALRTHIARIGKRPFQALVLYDWDGDPDAAQRILHPYFDTIASESAQRHRDTFEGTLRNKLLVERARIDDKNRNLDEGAHKQEPKDMELEKYVMPKRTRFLIKEAENQGNYGLSIDDVRYVREHEQNEKENSKTYKRASRMPICITDSRVAISDIQRITVRRRVANLKSYFERNTDNAQGYVEILGRTASVVNALLFHEVYAKNGETLLLDDFMQYVDQTLVHELDYDAFKEVVMHEIEMLLKLHRNENLGYTEIGKRSKPVYERDTLVGLQFGVPKGRWAGKQKHVHYREGSI